MKNKAILLARLDIRSETLDGGAIPDDEVQLDFVISNGEKDAFGSIMTDKTLRNYTEDAARGVPFMLNHGEDLSQQIGRTIAATYDEAEKQVRATVSMLRDTDETPENMKVNEYIRRIERKYYDSVSVGFRDATETCNICGKEIFDFHRSDPCPHIPKRMYNGVECTYDVDDGHLRELSLVTMPANAGAKLLDTRNWSEDLRKIKQEGDTGSPGTDDAKSILEKDGLMYRNSLIETAVAEGVRAEDDFDSDKWKERFASMPADQIVDQTATWKKLGDARWGEGGRKTESGSPTEPAVTNQSNTIVMPSYIFEY